LNSQIKLERKPLFRAIIDFIIALFSGFNWFFVGKAAILGTPIGFVAELLGILSDYT